MSIACIIHDSHVPLNYSTVTLKLSLNRLASTISEGLRNLTLLETLHLDDNFFQGTLPTSLSNLTNLKSVQLKSNSFSGNVFQYLPNWKQLGTL